MCLIFVYIIGCVAPPVICNSPVANISMMR